MSKRISMKEVRPNYYQSDDGFIMERETESMTPNGNKMNNRWVLRSPLKSIIDFDHYRNDIADRNNLDLND